MGTRREVGLHLKGLLRELDKDVTEVAACFESLGAQGRLSSAADCVIARYLKAVLGSDPEVRSVRVFPQSVHVRTSRFLPPVVCCLPVGLVQFVRTFDAGLVSQLVDQTAGPLSSAPGLVDRHEPTG